MSIPGYTRGSDLAPDQQRAALAAYCHRFTREPLWSESVLLLHLTCSVLDSTLGQTDREDGES